MWLWNMGLMKHGMSGAECEQGNQSIGHAFMFKDLDRSWWRTRHWTATRWGNRWSITIPVWLLLILLHPHLSPSFHHQARFPNHTTEPLSLPKSSSLNTRRAHFFIMHPIPIQLSIFLCPFSNCPCTCFIAFNPRFPCKHPINCHYPHLPLHHCSHLPLSFTYPSLSPSHHPRLCFMHTSHIHGQSSLPLSTPPCTYLIHSSNPHFHNCIISSLKPPYLFLFLCLHILSHHLFSH